MSTKTNTKTIVPHSFVCTVRAKAKVGKIYRHSIWGSIRILELGPVQKGQILDERGELFIHEPAADYRLAVALKKGVSK